MNVTTHCCRETKPIETGLISQYFWGIFQIPYPAYFTKSSQPPPPRFTLGTERDKVCKQQLSIIPVQINKNKLCSANCCFT